MANTDGVSKADIQYIPTYIDDEGNEANKTYPGMNFPMNWDFEEQAIEYLDYWFNENVLKPLGKDAGFLPHTATGVFDKLNEAIKKRELAKKQKKRTRDINEEIKLITESLRKFIVVFAKNYYMMAPIRSGTYVRSSIMYFTGDKRSRQIALKDAMLVNEQSSIRKVRQYIFGQNYVTRQLEPNEIFRKDRGSVEARLEKIRKGITLENVAFANRPWKGGDTYYYGWRRVEMWGWEDIGGPPPYSPFQNALQAAINQCGDASVGFSYTLHQEVDAY